jgi:hypothetical protein
MSNIAGRSVSRAILIGTAVCGTLDISDALIFYGVRNHIPPERILQRIASGLLGRSALTGGIPAALVGLAMHYAIAAFWVALFVFAAQRLPGLFRHAIAAGTIYGLLVYGWMNYVAVPLSRIGTRPGPIVININLINAVLALVFFIGIAVALVNKRYAPLR